MNWLHFLGQELVKSDVPWCAFCMAVLALAWCLPTLAIEVAG